jgi:hypothetical protein
VLEEECGGGELSKMAMLRVYTALRRLRPDVEFTTEQVPAVLVSDVDPFYESATCDSWCDLYNTRVTLCV